MHLKHEIIEASLLPDKSGFEIKNGGYIFH